MLDKYDKICGVNGSGEYGEVCLYRRYRGRKVVVYRGMNLGGKVVFGLSGLFIPTSSVVMIVNTIDVSSQTSKYLDLVSASSEKVSKAEAEFKLVSESRKSFIEAPKGYKFSKSYEDLMNFYLDGRRCYVKINLMSGGNIQVPQNHYRNLEDSINTGEKERLAAGIHSLGGRKTLDDACYKAGIGGVLGIKEDKTSGYKGRVFGTLHISKHDKGSKNYGTGNYQK